jgi:hypothetical protein
MTKNIEILNYKLPVSATVYWNPANKIARIQLDVSLFWLILYTYLSTTLFLLTSSSFKISTYNNLILQHLQI